MKFSINCIQGDIARQPILEAVVNAANAELTTGGGVAGAIHKAAGPDLDKACRPLAPISPGQAVITEAFNLPNQYIIHCLGPRYGIDQPEDKLLADCYKNALNLAEENNISSIGFPAISTGIFGYPLEEAARIALNAVSLVEKSDSLTEVVFVLFSNDQLQIFEKIKKEVLN